MYWLSSALLIFGFLMLINGGTPMATLLGIGMMIAGAIVFWKNSATRRYLDSRKDDDDRYL